jgi:hypothetical protein
MNMRVYAWFLLPCLSVAADTGRRLGYVMDDSSIWTARNTWLSNPTAAEATYGHISTWDTSGVTDMSYLFCAHPGSSNCNTAAASFNEDIGAWDTSGVTTMERMFWGASAFNQDIGGWAVHNVKSMYQMFYSASAFNRDIGGWAVHSVTRMDHMFYYASAFNRDIGDWAVHSVTDMQSMFWYASAFDQDLGWCVGDRVNLHSAFDNTPCASTSCGVEQSTWDDRDGNCVEDAAPEGVCCVSAYDQPFTDACGTTLTDVRGSGCCPGDFLLRYSHDIYEKMLIDYTRWDCVSFVGKEACDLMGPFYTWGSCWQWASNKAAATCKRCTEDNGFDVRACGTLFLQEAKGKWGDWYYNPGMNPYCHEHSCCASDPNDCCETNAAAVAGAVVVGFAVLAGLIGLYYKRCRKPAIAEPSTPKAQPEATSPKEEEATAVAPEAEESPQETLTEEAPPTKGWFWRVEPKPEPEGEAEETLAEQPPPPPAPEGEAESAPFAPEIEERPPPPGNWFSRAAPEPEPEFEPEPEC